MNLVTLDFETYYDKDYSLRKLSVEEYIRDPRFEVIGVGIKVNSNPATWYGESLVAGVLKQFDLPNCAVLAHNAAFDLAILNWRYGIRPKLILDTLSMARPHSGHTGVSLDALAKEYKLGLKGHAIKNTMGKHAADLEPWEMADLIAYCVNDVELTHRLFMHLKNITPQKEMVLIDRTIRMFSEPTLLLDRAVLEKHLEEIRKRHKDLLDSLGGESARDILMSNPKFAEALKELGVEPPTKISKTTGKETYAFAKTDVELKELLNHHDERVQALVAARIGVKSTIEETRTLSFLGISERGALPIMLNYWGAHTGRYSGGDGVNLQNLPRGGNLRKAVCAPANHVLIASDLSQIEARMLAVVAGQRDLVEAFANKRDVYSEFASEVYARAITKADTKERFVGKTCVLGLGYGMGAPKLRGTLAMGQGGISVDVDEGEAQRIVRIYRNKNHRIETLWRQCDGALHKMAVGGSGTLGADDLLHYNGNKLYLPNGTALTYPNLRSSGNGLCYDSRKGSVYIYGGKFVENIIQALSCIVIKDQIAAISNRYNVVLQVHDEIVCAVPEEQVEEAKEFIALVMSTPPTWATHLPIACELGVGKNYGEAK